jgi:hypothetical protein
MVITLTPELETALNELAERQGLAPEVLALNVLRERLVGLIKADAPRDEWERLILDAGSNCGVSLPNVAVSSEGLYE